MFPVAALTLTGCDSRYRHAREIVRRELGEPNYADFRRLRTKGNEHLVCGEVDASNQGGAGWRYFVAYIDQDRAVIAPPGGVTAAGEMGDSLLAGEAATFNHMCD